MEYPDEFTIKVKKVGEVYTVSSPEIPLKIGDDEDIKASANSLPLALEEWVNIAIMRESPTFFEFATGTINRILSFIHSRKTTQEQELESKIHALEKQLAEKLAKLHSLPTGVTYTIPCNSSGASSFDLCTVGTLWRTTE